MGGRELQPVSDRHSPRTAQRLLGLSVPLGSAFFHRLRREIAVVKLAYLFGWRNGNDSRDPNIAALFHGVVSRSVLEGMVYRKFFDRLPQLGVSVASVQHLQSLQRFVGELQILHAYG